MHPTAKALRDLVFKNGMPQHGDLLLEAANTIDQFADEHIARTMSELETARLQREILELSAKAAEFEPVLRLIACGPRADGTYNYCREACQQLAMKALQNER
jgi:hypothetical protein